MSDNELGVEVELVKNYPLVKETLERMGIRNAEQKKFYPSCYCVEDEYGRFKVYHFKELFLKEGKESNYDDIDELRRNTIIHFLEKWGLVSHNHNIDEILVQKIDVLSHKDKRDYRICHKFYFKKKV
jgi:hypothetical protein